jgi:hypothetical protein
MRMGFIVVCNIGEIRDIVGYEIELACFLVWSLVCYLVLGLYHCLGI